MWRVFDAATSNTCHIDPKRWKWLQTYIHKHSSRGCVPKIMVGIFISSLHFENRRVDVFIYVSLALIRTRGKEVPPETERQPRETENKSATTPSKAPETATKKSRQEGTTASCVNLRLVCGKHEQVDSYTGHTHTHSRSSFNHPAHSRCCTRMGISPLSLVRLPLSIFDHHARCQRRRGSTPGCPNDPSSYYTG